MRPAECFALVAPDTKIFGRARRKNFRRRSFLLRSRQSLKWFRQRSHVLPLNQSQQIIGWRTIVLRLAPVAKTFGRARHKKTSGGGHLSFARANSEKKIGQLTLLFRSAAICASVFWVAKTCGWRAVRLRPRQSQKLSVAPGTIKIGRRSHVLRSRQSKKTSFGGHFYFDRAGHKKNWSADTCNSLAPVQKF